MGDAWELKTDMLHVVQLKTLHFRRTYLGSLNSGKQTFDTGIQGVKAAQRNMRKGTLGRTSKTDACCVYFMSF